MISNILIQLKISYYCEGCDKTIKHKPKKNQLRCLTHNQDEISFQIKRTIKNLNLFDIDKTFKDYFTDRIRKFDLYLVKGDFNLFFNN